MFVIFNCPNLCRTSLKIALVSGAFLIKYCFNNNNNNNNVIEEYLIYHKLQCLG